MGVIEVTLLEGLYVPGSVNFLVYLTTTHSSISLLILPLLQARKMNTAKDLSPNCLTQEPVFTASQVLSSTSISSHTVANSSTQGSSRFALTASPLI